MYKTAAIICLLFLLSCSKQSHCDISNEYEQGALWIKVKNGTSYRFTNLSVEEVNIACLEPYSETRYIKTYLKVTNTPTLTASKGNVTYRCGYSCVSGESITQTGKFTYIIKSVREKNQALEVEQKEE